MQSIQTAGVKRAAQPGPVQVIAVTGGKGGVGKTSVAVVYGGVLPDLFREGQGVVAETWELRTIQTRQRAILG